jgi:hypothetical protein
VWLCLARSAFVEGLFQSAIAFAFQTMAPVLLTLTSWNICDCGIMYDCYFELTVNKICVSTSFRLPIKWEPGPVYTIVDGHELLHAIDAPFLIVIMKQIPIEVMSYNPRIIEELPGRVKNSFGANILISLPKHFDVNNLEHSKSYLKCWKLNSDDESDIVASLLHW